MLATLQPVDLSPSSATSVNNMSLLVKRTRESGKCPPSLISDDRVVVNDGFDDSLLRLLESTGFRFAEDPSTVDSFTSLLQMTSSLAVIPGDDAEKKKAALEQRRAILLAVVASTPRTSPLVSRIVANGYLSTVKLWLDDVLTGVVGGVDFLLHLLTCIVNLPVTKSTVKDSGMGKLIGTIEKHKICKGTPNETAIASRVQEIKDAWSASVKALKSSQPATNSDSSTVISNTSKRISEESSSPPASKRVKTETDVKKTSSFSSLLKKMSNSPKEGSSGSNSQSPSLAKKADKKGTAKRVKWSDHFGGALSVAKFLDGEEVVENEPHDASAVWLDRKKRDRMREKELLATAKRAKLIDDDDDDLDNALPTMQPKVAWRMPNLLPLRPDVPTANLVSEELSIQNERAKTVAQSFYETDLHVPGSPAQLSEIEQALDMTAQSSAVVSTIPFFVPEQPVPAQVPMLAPAPSYDPVSLVMPSYGLATSTRATPELVQSLGLPMFLVGQDAQALQTLASSPGLLATLVDAHGSYDQIRLMSLVQTLSSNNGNSLQQAAPYPVLNGGYGNITPTSTFGHVSTFQSAPPRTSIRSSADGNLHISGYGPTTTQADIIALFSPYVHVDEVVMKGTFSFVNTSDPVSAQRAREALNGTLLGGMPVRINAAQRKARDQTSASAYQSQSTTPTSSLPMPHYGGLTTQPVAPKPAATMYNAVPTPSPVVPPNLPAVVPNVDAVRDDRGNPATKNLFVAGYGPGTTEQNIRDMFSQYTNVIGVVSKGSFTFVNTSDRASAVVARQMLGGNMVNGGALRINFAKETGRLGTSFDLTYGPNTGPNARAGPASSSPSYYGRSF